MAASALTVKTAMPITLEFVYLCRAKTGGSIDRRELPRNRFSHPPPNDELPHERGLPHASIDPMIGQSIEGVPQIRPIFRSFAKAAEGTRTLDLLHGKQTL
jgi:hypothetical protein